MNVFLSISIRAILIFFMGFSGLYAQKGIKPADIERAGQSGWQFLKINSDARQSAMGGIISISAAESGNSASIFGNPALLTNVKNMDFALSHVNWIADIGCQSVAIAKRFGNIGVFGLSVVSVNYGDMPETINSPIIGEDRTETVVTGNMFTAGDIAAGLSYAKKFTDRLSIGANARWIREKIAEVSMTSVSIDFGTVYYTGLRSLRLAMVARNFGPDTHLVGWSEEYQAEAVDIKMPVDFRVGLAMDFFESEESPHFLTVAVEGIHPNDSSERINMGAEYSLSKMLYLRGGYRFNYDEEGFTFGAGLNYNVRGIATVINYAYVDFGRLQKVNMFSVGFSF